MRGKGFYAMWNGMDPSHLPEFNLMHARNHTLDHVRYLGPNGILSVRRHCDGVGSLPPFFSFYDMSSLDILTDAEHQDMRVAQSLWFMALRPHYRDHIRHHCHVLARSGAGTAGCIGTLLFKLSERAATDGKAGQALVDDLLNTNAITAAHFGRADPLVPTAVGGEPPPRQQEEEPVGILVIEGFNRFDLAHALSGVSVRLGAEGVAIDTPRWGHYALSLAVDFEELDQMKRLEQAN
ncbi:hypothetical protein [Microvirga sp. VF16]|uniref:hypothetical protein n=1 Tax=Microvirga sp. VF16 TaxID=2807101 RepID=UPI00193C9284|nr:hypothetical protein [Microvirga sp. VF16]QRM33179.1 hypothetical protein JO965_28270 [Microvirga sp. VF16]